MGLLGKQGFTGKGQTIESVVVMERGAKLLSDRNNQFKILALGAIDSPAV